MANPQVEDGFIRISRELFEALCKAQLSGSEFRIMLAIIRKTYGWQQTSDAISISQFEKLTGLTNRGVCKATKGLVNKKAVRREQKGSTIITNYCIEKDYNKWLFTTEHIGSTEQKGRETTEQTGNLLLNKKAPTIDTIQKKVKKANTTSIKTVFRKPNIAEILEYCKERGSTVDPEYFFDKMELVGWVYGKHKTPVKDWKAVIRTWDRYSNSNNQSNAEVMEGYR